MRDFIFSNSRYVFVKEPTQLRDCYFIPNNQSIISIPNDIQYVHYCEYIHIYQYSIIIPAKSFQELQSLTIGKNCFKSIRIFILDSFPSLRSVHIGSNCFGVDDGDICQITNCPSLVELEIGNHSFRNFKSFNLSDLNSLQSIKFGEYCFRYSDFVLNGR